MDRGHRAGEGRPESLVPVVHDVGLLVVLPLLEHPVHLGNVEVRVVGGVNQVLCVVALEVDLLVGGPQSLLAFQPGGAVGCHLGSRGQLYAAEHHIAGPPGLRVEHVEGVVLVLHTQVEEPGVRLPRHALVEPGRPEPVLGLES